MKMLLVFLFLGARLLAMPPLLISGDAPPVADVLRQPYGTDTEQMSSVADVLRGPYEADMDNAPVIADVLRYPYEHEDHQGAAPVIAYIMQENAKNAAGNSADSDAPVWYRYGH